MKTSPCASCGAPVVWTITKAGKRMPVDAERVPNGNILLYEVGAEIHCQVGLQVQTDRAYRLGRFVSHYATCPQADSWRGKRRG